MVRKRISKIKNTKKHLKMDTENVYKIVINNTYCGTFMMLEIQKNNETVLICSNFFGERCQRRNF